MSSASLESLEGIDSFNIVVNQPTLSDDGPKSKKPWKYLSKFEVTCQGYSKVRCPVYANGRQQIPIQINVEARDEDGVIVDVNHGRLYLNLCLYDEVDVFPPELGRSGAEDSRFVYNHTVVNALATPEDNEGLPVPLEGTKHWQVVKQFVSAKKVGTYKLAVRCRSPDWVLFVTNTPNPPAGKFDSWLLVDAREPVAISWTKVKKTRIDAVNVSYIDVDLYYLYFDCPNLRVVATSHSPGYPANTSHYRWKNGGKMYDQICYGAAGGSRLINWRACHGSTCQFRVYDRPGQATVARITTSSASSCSNYRQYGVYLGLIDQYGNESRVGIRPIYSGNEITLVDPNTRDLYLDAEGELVDPGSE